MRHADILVHQKLFGIPHERGARAGLKVFFCSCRHPGRTDGVILLSIHDTPTTASSHYKIGGWAASTCCRAEGPVWFCAGLFF